jgi:two-component system, OmpR family, sensor histidine kinase BaeS
VSQPQQKEISEELLTRLIHRMARSTGAFRSTAQALLNGADEDPVLRRELLRDMEFELGELQRTLENVTQYKALEKGTFVLNPREVLTASWLRQLVGRWQRTAPDKALVWLIEIPENLPVLTVDVDKLEQALNNLLGNAVRHTPVGAQISFRAWSTDGDLHIRISSGRPHLVPDEYDRLAELFYTGEAQGRFPFGVGLGLYVTLHLVEMHDGVLEVARPEPEDDAIGFELRIPVKPPANGRPGHRRREEGNSSAEKSPEPEPQKARQTGVGR